MAGAAKAPAKAEPQTPDGYALVVSPHGATTTVPDAIVDALIESGYTRK